jgi:hypothetical protein
MSYIAIQEMWGHTCAPTFLVAVVPKIGSYEHFDSAAYRPPKCLNQYILRQPIDFGLKGFGGRRTQPGVPPLHSV